MPTRNEVLIDQIKRFNLGRSVQSRYYDEGLGALATSKNDEDVNTLFDAISNGILNHVRLQGKIGPLISKLARADTNHGRETLRMIFEDPHLFARVASTHKQNAFSSLINANSPDSIFTLKVGCAHGLLDQIQGEVLLGYLNVLMDINNEHADDVLVSLFERGTISRLNAAQIETLKTKIGELPELRAQTLIGSLKVSEEVLDRQPGGAPRNGNHTVETLGTNRGAITEPAKSHSLHD